MRRHAAVLALAFFVVLPLQAAITGIVMTADGQPIAGATISIHSLETPVAQTERLLSKSPERPSLAQVQSDAKGRFTIATPKDPVVVIVIRAAGYGQWSTRADREDELGAIALRKAEMKRGRITADGKPVPGALVVWTGSGEFIATTDAEGRYSVPDPAKWASEVALIHPDYPSVTEPAFQGMSSTVAIDRSFPKSVAISGKVVAADGKTPVAGATVRVDGHPATTSGQDGSFTIAHASEKWKAVSATADDRIGTRVKAGASQPVIRLSRAGVVSGTIRDVKTGAPIAGADVRLRKSGRFEQMAVVTTFSDAKGSFTAAGIPPGTYDITTIRPGYSVEVVPVTLTEGEKVSKRLLATQLGRVAGTAVDEQRHGVAAASVSFRSLARDQMMMFGPMTGVGAPAMTAPDGTFILRVTPDTDVELSATRKGYPSGRSSTLKLAPGERRSGIVLTIPSGMAVTGRVLDRQGKPVAGVTVEASETSPTSGAQIIRRMAFGALRERDDAIKTADDGTFGLRLKEGTYDFGFRRDGYAGKAVRAVQVTAATKPVEITLDPGVEITGRVMRSGQPLSEVNINVMSESSNAFTQTGPDGSFRLSGLTPGPTMLMAGRSEDFIQLTRTITAPASDVTIDVPAGGRVAGRVVDKNTRQPITSFDLGVSAARGGGGFVMMGGNNMRPFTSDDGSFVLENVPPGPTALMVRAPGYTVARASNLNVEDGKSLDDVTVEMDRGVRLVGRVTGPDGSPLAGVSVRIDSRADRIRVYGMEPNTTTDENGNYTLDSLEAGDKTFLFVRAGYLTAEKSVSLSGQEVRADVQMGTGMKVTGTVVTDSGVPVADANVSASSAAQAAMGGSSTRTDASGNFTIDGLAPGRYSFYVSKTGYPAGNVRDFDITAGAPVRITLKSGGVISGQVTGLAADELAQAMVMAYSSATPGGATAAVDATGNYRIEGAPTGTVRVSARVGSGFPGGRQSAVQSVQVEPGSEVKVDVAFKSDTVVRGRITRNGQPVDGAMVSFYPKQPPAQTNARVTANSAGEYQVTGLEDGPYTVMVVDMQRSAPYSATYQVKGSGTFDVDMKSAALRGHVTSSDGDPVADAVIEVREASEIGARFAIRSAQTDASGSFVIDAISPGTYNVSATRNGYGAKVVPAEVSDNGGEVNITLSPNAGVMLTVVDARDGRAISAFVHVTDMQGRTVYDTPGFGGGSTEGQKLPLDPGTYRATISASSYAPQRITITSPSSPRVGLTPGGSIALVSKGSSMRRARLMGPDGQEYRTFTIDPSPGVTVVSSIAPGTYTVQILGEDGQVTASAPATVAEGQRVQVTL